MSVNTDGLRQQPVIRHNALPFKNRVNSDRPATPYPLNRGFPNRCIHRHWKHRAWMLRSSLKCSFRIASIGPAIHRPARQPLDNGGTTAQPAFSRFAPMGRILFFDDFDNGINGWIELIGNYEDTLDSILPPFKYQRPPQLSSISMWDTGTVGSMDGSYALKVATRPKKGHQASTVKRVTYRKTGPILFTNGNSRKTRSRFTTSAEPAERYRIITFQRKTGSISPEANRSSATTKSQPSTTGITCESILILPI